MITRSFVLRDSERRGKDEADSFQDYYVGNGISDSTGELFIEAWCQGGIGGGQCTRLKLSECFQNVRIKQVHGWMWADISSGAKFLANAKAARRNS